MQKTNTCPNCAKSTSHEVNPLYVSATPTAYWCADCIRATPAPEREPNDASGFTEDVTIEILS